MHYSQASFRVLWCEDEQKEEPNMARNRGQSAELTAGVSAADLLSSRSVAQRVIYHLLFVTLFTTYCSMKRYSFYKELDN